MDKFTVEVMLSTGESIKIENIEASNEEEAINTAADFRGADYVYLNQESTYYRIYKSQLVGFKVISSKDSDEGPVKQTLN